MINHYRRSLPNAASVQAPLFKYTQESKKNDKGEILWFAEAERAFKKVKEDLANAALLSHPASDAQNRVVTDASDFAMGAVLEQ